MRTLQEFKSSIYTHANGLRTTPKKRAAAVDMLIEHIYDNASDKSNAVVHELAVLYSQYLPKASAKPKTSYDWVYNAAGKSDYRCYLNQLNVKGYELRATDGHRVHVSPSKGAPLVEGYYDRNRNRVEVAAKFPDIGHLIPSHTGVGRHGINTSALNTSPVVKVHGRPVVELRAPINSEGLDSVYVNIKYLKDVMSNPSPVATASIGETYKDLLYVTFEDGSQAMVMPIKGV